jgi:hypothetical protein
MTRSKRHLQCSTSYSDDPLEEIENLWRRLHILLPPEAESLPFVERERETSRYVSQANELVGELSDSYYNVREAYEQAHALRDPYKSPHGFFLKLAHRNNHHALEFLENFGPLILPIKERTQFGNVQVRVSLDEFWGLHLRFCSVAKLWVSRNDTENLASALLELYRRRDEASRSEKFPLGATFSPPPESALSVLEFPWEKEDETAKDWLGKATRNALWDVASHVITSELNLHLRDRQLRWKSDFHSSNAKCQLVIWLDSLWSVLWEFLALDIAGTSWRQCPHCQKFFYPKRKDQVYCTPRQQALASKRHYAARRRDQTRQETLVAERGEARKRKGRRRKK